MVTQEEFDTRLASAELRAEANAKVAAEAAAAAKAREMAKAMLTDGDSIEKIARISGLSENPNHRLPLASANGVACVV